jgi:hypothetical protein
LELKAVAKEFLALEKIEWREAVTKYPDCPKGNKLVAVGKLEERHPRTQR